jgi:hypothetical protein
MPNRDLRTLRGSRHARPLSFAPIIALAILAVGIAYAQQNLPVPPKPAAAEPAPADNAAVAADAEPAAGTEPQDGASTAVPSPTTGKGSPQRFEPTEKVRPDFDVAFPVDI